jgi:hypothetical protein
MKILEDVKSHVSISVPDQTFGAGGGDSGDGGYGAEGAVGAVGASAGGAGGAGGAGAPGGVGGVGGADERSALLGQQGPHSHSHPYGAADEWADEPPPSPRQTGSSLNYRLTPLAQRTPKVRRRQIQQQVGLYVLMCLLMSLSYPNTVF